MNCYLNLSTDLNCQNASFDERERAREREQKKKRRSERNFWTSRASNSFLPISHRIRHIKRVKWKRKMSRHLQRQSYEMLISHKAIVCQHFPAQNFHTRTVFRAQPKVTRTIERRDRKYKKKERRRRRPKRSFDRQKPAKQADTFSWVLQRKWQPTNMRAVEHFTIQRNTP